MPPAFVSGNQRYLPQATITFDKWHVIKLINKHLNDLSKHPKYTYFVRYIALLMEDISHFHKQKRHDMMKAQLQFIADFAYKTFGENAISKCIHTHFEGITNYAKSKLNNGIL